jgi:hypothetical protein
MVSLLVRNIPKDPNWLAVSQREVPNDTGAHILPASELEFIKIIGSGSFGILFFFF